MKKYLLLLATFFVIQIGGVCAQSVYITESGRYYHTSHCAKINLKTNSPIPLWKAKTYGKNPCPECKPPAEETSSTPKKEKTKKAKKTTAVKSKQAKPVK